MSQPNPPCSRSNPILGPDHRGLAQILDPPERGVPGYTIAIWMARNCTITEHSQAWRWEPLGAPNLGDQDYQTKSSDTCGHQNSIGFVQDAILANNKHATICIHIHRDRVSTLDVPTQDTI